MKDNIFSDLYDRVLSFFTSTTNEKEESKLMAKNRLRAVLMQDRAGFSERAMQMLKDDMLETISRYLEIDVNSFDLSLDATDETTVLNLSIPVLRPKTDEEIDEILSIEQKAKIEKTQEIVGEIQQLVKEKAQVLAQLSDEDDEADVEEEAQENAQEDIEQEEIENDANETVEEIQEIEEEKAEGNEEDIENKENEEEKSASNPKKTKKKKKKAK